MVNDHPLRIKNYFRGMNKTLLITGGAGFIGSHVVRLFVTKYPDYKIVNLDALTYAGNLENLKDIENAPNYQFVKGDIVDADFVNNLFEKEQFANGTSEIANVVANASAYTVVGGGDSVSAIRQYKLESKIDHVSTGGGATLEYIEQGTLVGVEALLESNK